jgi:hypothetical protein
MTKLDSIEDMDDHELQIDKDYVQRRVDDWIDRLHKLKASVKAWAQKNNWIISDFTTAMHEELMQNHGIPSRPLPGLILTGPNNTQVSIKPKGLWVIGANGRVDIYSPKGAYVLVDIANHFQQAKWVLYRPGEKQQGQAFAPALLATMV